jgi:hypothetical protein
MKEETFTSTKPSNDPESGLRYIQNAALAAQKVGQRLWQIDGEEEVLAAASTEETEDSIVVQNLGSIVSGKGREVLQQIAHYAAENKKKLVVSATFDSEKYYQKLKFKYIPGSNNLWEIDPKILIEG